MTRFMKPLLPLLLGTSVLTACATTESRSHAHATCACHVPRGVQRRAANAHRTAAASEVTSGCKASSSAHG